MSVAWFGVGNLDAGQRAAMRAHRLSRRRVETIYNIALANVRAERWDRARAWIRRGRESAPDDAALRRLGFLVRWHTTVKTIRWLGMVFVRRRSRYGLAASRR